MVSLADLTPPQRLHVMLSGRYSIRNAEVFDEAAGRFVNADEITEGAQ